MDRISGLGFMLDGNGHRVFQNENQGAGVDGTDVDATWLTGIQEELIGGLIEPAGLNPNSADNTLVGRAVAIVGRRALSFTAPGNYNWVCPAGVYMVWARVVGAGGGGCDCIASGSPASSNSGSGGGAGGYSEGYVPVVPGTVYAIVVGVGGTAQVAGGTSSFAALSATGGGGASFTAGGVSPGGTPGVGTGGNVLNAAGGYGSDGQSGSYRFAGNGAPGPFGGGGRAGDGGGANGGAPGAGGGGAYDSTNANTLKMGGSGAPGAVLLAY